MKRHINFTWIAASRSPAVLAVIACLLACFAAGAYAQDAKIDLSHLDKLASKASKVTNVSLEGPMLKLAAEDSASAKGAMAKQKSDAEILQRLKGIYVRAYKFSKPGEYSRADLNGVLKQLHSGGWTSVVNVEKKKEGAMTAIYVMNEGGETVGMTVVAAKPEKLTVVNLVGPMDFSQLGALDGLDSILGDSTARVESKSQPPAGSVKPAR